MHSSMLDRVSKSTLHTQPNVIHTLQVSVLALSLFPPLKRAHLHPLHRPTNTVRRSSASACNACPPPHALAPSSWSAPYRTSLCTPCRSLALTIINTRRPSMGEPSSPALSSKLAFKCRSLEAILHETFSSISSLRDALQMPDNLGSIGCDNNKGTYLCTEASQKKVILRELKKLSELKHRYRWRSDGSFTESHTQTGTPLTYSDGWSSESEGTVAEQQRFDGAGNSTASLKMELQKKDAEIRNLTATVERLVAKKDKLERRVKKLAERSKASCHGNGIAMSSLDKSWDRLGEEDLAMASHLTGNGMHAAHEQIDNLSKKAARTGGEALIDAAVSNAAGNGVLGECGAMNSSKTAMRSGAINNEKLYDANFDKQRRRREIVESSIEKQGRSELRKMFDVSMAEVTDTVSEFSKALVVLMKRAKWDIEECGVQWVRESHKALAVQSYVCMRMFRGFENEDFYMSGRLSWLLDPAKHREECRQQFEAMVQMVEEPLDLLAGMAPGSAFGQFCRKKFLQIFPASMEEALLGDLRHRDCLLQEAAHPHWSRFYQAFVRMAKAIWTVHKLAFSLEQRLSIFQAEKGADFAATYMVSHIPNLELASDTHNLLPKVAFTIMPGFRVGENVFLKCRVYLNGMKLSSPANSQG